MQCGGPVVVAGQLRDGAEPGQDMGPHGGQGCVAEPGQHPFETPARVVEASGPQGHDPGREVDRAAHHLGTELVGQPPRPAQRGLGGGLVTG